MARGVLKHGHSRRGAVTAEYRIWAGIFNRCTNPKLRGWKNYGGRGITLCDRWYEFEAFLADMGPRPSPHHSVDRINNDGNYEPENCRWATSKEQNRNRRDNRKLEHGGRCLSVSEWAALTGLSRGTIETRLSLGWSVADALTKPLVHRLDPKLITHDGRSQRLIDWSAETGVAADTLWRRLFHSSWSAEKALTTPARPRRAGGARLGSGAQ